MVVASQPYQRAIQNSNSNSQRSPATATASRNITTNNPTVVTDEGYGTGVTNTPNTTSAPTRSPSLEATKKGIPKWLKNDDRPGRAQSNSTFSSLGTRSSRSTRERIRSIVRRLSSSGSSGSPVTANNSSPGTRCNRGRGAKTSIDWNADTPLIVKFAQTGSRADVEQLIENKNDIEARHLHTRRNALLVAAHCGNADIVDLLIQNNARLDVADAWGCTALHLAASRGHVRALGLLLVEEVDIEARNSHGATPLWLAAEHGQLNSMRILIAAHAKVNARSNYQMNALHVAAKRGDADIVDLLISSGADLEAKDTTLKTALHYASEEGRLAVVELLLNNRINVDTPGSDLKTPLICAAQKGQTEVVQLLLKRKVFYGFADAGGTTALHWAAFNGHTEVVSLLSSKKKELAMTDDTGKTALHLAVSNKQFAVVELLLRKDKSALETRCKSGFTPLHHACVADSPEIANLLLFAGADIEATTDDKLSQRPVHIAASRASMNLLNLLCNKGASLEARDAEGDRALCIACYKGHVAAVHNMLQRGDPMHLRSGDDDRLYGAEDSALCQAALGGHLPVVSLLIQHGASVSRRDEKGWQAARYAVYHGHPEVLQLLLSYSPPGDVLDGLSAEIIGFHATISEERKRMVSDILDQRRHVHPATGACVPCLQRNPSRLAQVSPFEPARHERTAVDQPQELPGSLEQGLPDSRSATPDQMRGRSEGNPRFIGIEPPQHTITAGLVQESVQELAQQPAQQSVPIHQPIPGRQPIQQQSEPIQQAYELPIRNIRAIEQLTQQPVHQPTKSRTVSPFEQSAGRMQYQPHVSEMKSDKNIDFNSGPRSSTPGVFTLPAFFPVPEYRVTDPQDTRRFLALHNRPKDDGDKSETSSVSSVYTAPEENDHLRSIPSGIYELPG